ncbi:MAG: putative baseplate assembly protein, partial [Anaerolineae bacterium]|nr:putative baseplate assembly protein [Anaerolineae bacterium]
RRPITTEMYVIGCEYIKLGVSVGVTILGEYEEDEELRTNSTFSLIGRDAVLSNIRETLRRFLWPLMPGGVAGTGWPLGRNVRDRELEVVVARVPGVDTVLGVNLFIEDKANKDWKMLPRPTPSTLQELVLGSWQLPELMSVVVVADENPPQHLRGVANPFAEDGVAIPVVPKVC